MSIHPTAIIEPGARVGQNVSVGAFSVVGADVVLGDDCTLHRHAIVVGHTTLGDGCEVFPHAVIGMPPQDIKYEGERTSIDIGKGNVFREMVTIHPGTANGGGITQIGDDNLMLVGAHVAHDCRIGNQCIFANYVQFAGHVHVEDNVNIGGHTAVHHFVTIGKNAFVGGMTRVPADVPPYMIIVAARGTRSEVRMVNGVGLQRSGYSQDDIAALKDAFMRIYARRARFSGVAIQDRVQAVLDEKDVNSHVVYLCDFLLRSFAHGRHGRYLESLRRDPARRASWKYRPTDDLTINVEGGGVVSRLQDAPPESEPGVVELFAKADPGWRFVRWNGDLSGSANPVRIAVSTTRAVTATFAELG